MASVVDQIHDKDVITKLDQLFLAAVEHQTTKDWLKHAQKDNEFKEGKQWTDKEIQELSSRGQPDIVENEIFYKVNSIKGRYKKQKTKIIFRGRNIEQDEPIANDLSDLTLHILQRSQYEFQEDQAFEDGITAGVGYLIPTVEFDDAYQPEIIIRYEDNFNVFIDPYSKAYDLSDAHYACIAKWVHIAEAQALYPDKSMQIKAYVNGVTADGNTSGIDKMRGENYVDDKNQRVRLIEVRYKEKKKKSILVYSSKEQGSQIIDLSDMKPAKIKKLQKELPDASVVDRLEDNVKVAVYCGNVLLEEEKDWPHDYKSLGIIPYYVYRKKNGEPYGVVRMLIDPQTEINKRRSKALHLLMTNQTISEEGNIKDEDDYKSELAKPDGLMIVRNREKTEIIKNVEVAQTQMELLAESKGAMDRIVGIPSEPTSSEQIRSGVGVARKQAAVDMPVTPIFENLRRTRLIIGKHIYELIKQYYTEEKVMYILDDAQKSKQFSWTQQHINSIKEGIYDVIVEEMPDTTTLQEEQFQMVTQLLQSLNLPPQLGMAMFPLVIQLSQLRDKKDILDKFNQLNQPSPILPKVSINYNWSDMTKFEKAAIWEMQGKPEIAQMEMQQGIDPASIIKANEGIQKTQIKAQADMAKNQTDPREKEQELALKSQEHQMDMQHSHEKHVMDMNSKEQEHGQKMRANEEMRKMDLMYKAIESAQMLQEKKKSEGNKNTTSKDK